MIAGFSRVGVIGAGQMGSGIAQVMATTGLGVTLIDSSEAQLEKAKRSILFYTDALESLKNCDLVVEAIIENESIKKELFSKLDQLLPKDSVIASNTSSISIARLGSATKRPEKVIGMHFMNPVPIMKLVEIIPSISTSMEVQTRVKTLATALGKEISMSKDYPGFIVNRILMPMINEAFFALMEGVGTAEDIDQGMKLGTNQPMGPLALADFIGLDTCLFIMRVLHDGMGDSKYRPCPLLVQYVDAGWLGKKTGRGIYQY
jgi:3-hydroxybutyryl-CoA dehydrogenase